MAARRLAGGVDVGTKRTGRGHPDGDAAQRASYSIERDATLGGPRCQLDAERALEAVLASVFIRLAAQEATARAA